MAIPAASNKSRSLKTPKPVTIDFETQRIKTRPEYPPIPCGVSIKYPGKKAHYYAWGHATNNNCTKKAAELELQKAYCWEGGLLFHNSKFDVDVANVHMGVPLPPWGMVHDTLYLIFLDDPHQTELGLKPSAARILGWDQSEKDAVGEWLLKNQPVPGVKLSKSRKSEFYYMNYVNYAPGDLVGTYANSDVDKTHDLFKVLWPDIKKRGMLVAYDRERRLMPCLLDMERRGVQVDTDKLMMDISRYELFMDMIETWIKRKVKAPYTINLDASAELMDAMIASKVVNEDQLVLTPTGKIATNKDALLVAVSDKQLLSMLSYRAQLKTCLNTFMKNWYEVAKKPESQGRIFCYFNQVRSDKANDAVGARTGRLSSSPNFLNLPKEFKPLFYEHQKLEDRKKKPLPKSPIRNLPPLPQCRSYIVPFDGEVLVGRDYSGQELRVLAHVCGGGMEEAYNENQHVDFHEYAKNVITDLTGIKITRYDAKQIAFSIIYGSGIGHLAEALGCTVNEATLIKSSYLDTFPAIREVQKELKARAKAGLPLWTVGGRQYYVEPPKTIQGRTREYSYKLLNYLVQGSSADQTKEAVIQLYDAGMSAHLILLVHDEIVMSTPVRDAVKNSAILHQVMVNAIPLSVPMITDCDYGFDWGNMRDDGDETLSNFVERIL